ncbi:hypothetical protein [Paenibacillus sp. 453mf]|uniref:hypothetical protein n=1 Tax=Paenibacillus sp. 453mf TaxID=1761874 RepID=UPI0008EBCFE6|nr:hypothetical protein [Paenibacillus sp. 453mf]SFS83279.1 hypothetical protein SAMN04488601_104197 [Paenibacillus sp. 453mf]
MKPTVADMMKAYAEDAVESAEKLGVMLDYSEDSIKSLEGILQRYHEELPRGVRKMFRRGPSEQEKIQMSKAWGGYLGETLIKHLGGEWQLSSVSEDTIALVVSKSINGEEYPHEIYPPSKVYRRIMNGPEDNVWHYYCVLKEDLSYDPGKPSQEV